MENLSSIENTALVLAKYGIIFFLFIYLIFAVIVMRQVKIMTDTLKVGFEAPVRSIALLHVVAAAFVLLLSFFIL